MFWSKKYTVSISAFFSLNNCGLSENSYPLDLEKYSWFICVYGVVEDAVVSENLQKNQGLLDNHGERNQKNLVISGQ